jgi:hypothetical protein
MPGDCTGVETGQQRSGTGDGQKRNTPLFAAMAAALAIAATLVLYREAIHFPFLFDDMIHMRWLDGNSLLSIWTSAEGLGYYRPLTMSVWKVGHMLLGRNDPPLLHAFNLFLHALNAFLTGCIAWRAYRGRGSYTYALLATLLFVTFPFSYQAVPSTSSLSKPFIATLTLVSALLYWQGRRRGSKWLLGLSLLVGILAPFAYETGVMVPLAIVAVEILGYTRKEFERQLWLPVLYAILIWGLALPLIILMEPEGGAPVRLPTLLPLWQNGVYFSQGLVFPVAPLATPTSRILPLDHYVLVAAIALLGLLALFVFYHWVRQLGLFLYALSWFVVGILPLWFMLEFSYVITSPRLFYLGAVGSALLWAGVPTFLWNLQPARWWARILAVGATLGMLVFGVSYVRQRMVLADAVAQPLWQAVLAAETHGDSSELLYLNVPAWVAPKEPIYLIGTEGLTFIPGYVRVQDFVYVTGDVEPKIRSVIFDPAKQDWRAFIGYSGNSADWNGVARRVRRVDSVYSTTYSPDSLRLSQAGALEAAGHVPAQGSVQAAFGDQFLLLGHRVEEARGEAVVDLWWYGHQVPQEDLTVFLHVYDAAGQLVTQADGYPLLGLYPPTSWHPGDLVRDRRYLSLPEGATLDGHRIVVGWYDKATADRLPAVDPAGLPVLDNAIQLFPP